MFYFFLNLSVFLYFYQVSKVILVYLFEEEIDCEFGKRCDWRKQIVILVLHIIICMLTITIWQSSRDLCSNNAITSPHYYVIMFRVLYLFSCFERKLTMSSVTFYLKLCIIDVVLASYHYYIEWILSISIKQSSRDLCSNNIMRS